MQLMKFVTRDTKDKNKILVWCTTNRLITFRDFMQYVLDNLKNPKDFMIIDTEKDLVYDMYKVATEMYGMKERTFEERMNDVHTGKWAKYSNDELKSFPAPVSSIEKKMKVINNEKVLISSGHVVCMGA